jgi:hypothetical protein
MSDTSNYRYCYIHGFGSGPKSKKGVILADYTRKQLNGLELLLPDCNHPSFTELTISNALGVIDKMDADQRTNNPNVKWRMMGSSLGGYLVALWAMRNPEKVDRVMLLCPAFDVPGRWRTRYGPEVMEQWRVSGFKDFVNFANNRKVTPLSYNFIEDSEKYPAVPIVPSNVQCLVIHGTEDESVPIDISRKYVAELSSAKLIEVKDSHELIETSTLDLIKEQTRTYLCA